MTKTIDRTADALKTLEEGILKLVESGEWTCYLKMQAAFHRYSFANTMLILAQCPDATKVAGFKTWQKLGRQVRKGEKALWILAPRTFKPKPDADADDEGAGEEVEPSKSIVVSFRPVGVFDVSQTDGDDLPNPVRKLTGDDGGLLARMKTWAEAWGCPVTIADVEGSANGFYEPDRHAITVRAGMAPVQQLKTLVHELAHAHLHRDIEVYRAHRGDCELEAESVAFVVLHHFGVDAGDYTFGYVTGWQGGGDEAIASLKLCAKRIQSTAKGIIEGIVRKDNATSTDA